MPTTRFDCSYLGLTSYAWIARLARFLINDLGGSPVGPAWTIIEAYDSSINSRRVPTVGAANDMDNVLFSAGGNFGWQLNALGDNDWIVLRSATSNAGTKFEVYFKIINSTRLDILLCPLDNWATDIATPTATPVLPAVAVGVNLTTPVQLTTFAGPARYSIVADESMFVLLTDASSSCFWIYVGEVDSTRVGGHGTDDRPFVISYHPEWVGIASQDPRCARISPLDHATLLTAGTTCDYRGTGDNYPVAANQDGALLGDWTVFPSLLYFYDTSHRHVAGWMRNVFQVNRDLGAVGLLGNRSFLFRAYNYYNSLALRWDGLTDYP